MIRFDQSSPVQPVSDFREGGTVSVTDGQRTNGNPRVCFWIILILMRSVPPPTHTTTTNPPPPPPSLQELLPGDVQRAGQPRGAGSAPLLRPRAVAAPPPPLLPHLHQHLRLLHSSGHDPVPRGLQQGAGRGKIGPGNVSTKL